MDPQGTFAADLIAASSKALAAGAVQRHDDAVPGLVSGYGLRGFSDLVYDTQVRLEYLCAALAAGKVELFADHLSWLRITLTAKDAPAGFLPDSLRHLADELCHGLPAAPGELAADYLEQGLESLAVPQAPPPSLLEGDAPLIDLTRRYMLAVLENRTADAIALATGALQQGHSVGDVLTDVVARAQEEIGRMWQVGEVTVAEEHFCSRIAERVIMELERGLTPAESNGKKVICTAVGGNLHDIGIRIVSIHFEQSGWQPILLGANMPIIDLVRAVADFEADLLAVSANLALQIRPTADLIRHVRGIRETASVPVLVGGRLFGIVPDLCQVVGADGEANSPTEAVELASRLTRPR